MKRVKPFIADEQDVKNFNDQGFLRKLARYALRLGRPVVEQLYGLYYMLLAEATPMRSKMVIVGALLFLRPDSWLFAPFFAFMLFGLVNSLFSAIN